GGDEEDEEVGAHSAVQVDELGDDFAQLLGRDGSTPRDARNVAAEVDDGRGHPRFPRSPADVDVDVIAEHLLSLVGGGGGRPAGAGGAGDGGGSRAGEQGQGVLIIGPASGQGPVGVAAVPVQ